MIYKTLCSLTITGMLLLWNPGLSAAATSANDNSINQVPAVECRERGGLPNFFSKLRRGQRVRVAYLGGSITAQNGWRPKTTAWFRENFPQAKVEEIDAAIGGTGSDLGVCRLKHDVLDYEPDLLFVEFAVNDGGTAPEQIYRTMEGIVRQTWKHGATTDICFIYTLAGNMLETLQQGHFPRAAAAMEKIADHYHIPSVHLGVEVARLEKLGKLVFKGEKPKTDAEKLALGDKILFSPDAVHPYVDTGHQLYLAALVRSFAKLKGVGKPGSHVLSTPFINDNWERATLLPLSRATLSSGWQRLDSTAPLVKSFGRRLPELWKATKPGESLFFRFRGTAARIYDILGPDCGQVSVTLDDHAPIIKARFDAFTTYPRLAWLAVGEGLPDAIHTVNIAIAPGEPDKAKILAERGEKMDDPKRFEGSAWYAGALLLVGELIDNP